MNVVRELPPFSETVLDERRHRYCVCVFVIDEGQRLLDQLERMQAVAAEVDVIVADGGSTDGSTEPNLLRTRGVRALLVKQGPGRLSAQMRMAFHWALEQGYSGCIVIDGNGKDDVSALPRFVEALDAGFDHVQGSRYMPGGQAVRTPWLRHVGVRTIHAPAVAWAARFPYTDTTNGFRAYSARLLIDPRVHPFRAIFDGYGLHYYLAIRSARLGFRGTEIPVTRSYPPRGAIPTKIRGWRGYAEILATLARACLHRFDPADTEAA